LLVETDLLVDHKGKVRLDVEKRFQWTKAISTELAVSFRQTAKTELEATLLYGPAWAWAIGLMVTEEKVGAGAQIRF